jgi:serine/threonine protein kinase
MLMTPLIRKVVPGDIVGRCRIIRELGRGGVGTVYLADHQTLQIEVAIKILSPSLSLDNPARGERFIREAQIAARIRHPNVIAVMDAALDEPSGAYYIVMEYVSGGSLAWHLRNGPLPEAKALAIVTGIAQALVIAEENRIVHRDIKPENIMLDPRGTPKLADLGLAKHVIDSRTSITIGGSFMGTPAYMSPEQARDAKVADTRDDIYSLGASFYECLTGVPPFQGETPYNIMSELLTKPSPRPRDLRPELLKATDLVCRKMMAKTRDLRYATARDLLADLQHLHEHGARDRGHLLAANFERDADLARQRELHRESKYGIATSSDGAYAEPLDPPGLPATVLRQAPVFPPPRRDRAVFGAAALLIALVVITTVLFAWAGPNHPLALLEKKFAAWTGTPAPAAPTASEKPKSTKPKEHEHVAATKPAVHESRPPQKIAVATYTPPPNAPGTLPFQPNPTPGPALVTSLNTPPVALPAEPLTTDTNAVPAVPVNPGIVPAVAATPDSAFAARNIAEEGLDPGIIMPTGHAPLLRIIGERDPAAITPTTWKFYFFDKTAPGHNRIVTVSGGKVVKSGGDIADALRPYTEQLVLPESDIRIDSTDALQIAQTFAPDVTLTGSEFILMQQRNSVPMWKVTLWGKKSGEDEHRIGDVTLLAESGTVISRNLKP